jgi:hypothetical protein
MKNTKWLRALSLSLLALILCPIQAFACACCADDGEYRISFRKPTSSEIGLLGDMRFGPTANLFQTAGEPPAGSPQSATYNLTSSMMGRLWKLTFRDGNKNGTLSLSMPLKMLSYAVDTHDGAQGSGGGPILYKEWRFEGRPTATGIFRQGNSTPTSYFLVFQGRGNRCDNAEDFSHWRLELKGPRASYAFFGQMQR